MMGWGGGCGTVPAQPSDQTRAMASVLYYLMTEDGGTEAGWEIGDDGAVRPPSAVASSVSKATLGA